MKRPLIFFLLIGLVLFLSIFFLRDKIKQDFSASLPYPTNAPTPTGIAYAGNAKETLSLFVPYWTVNTRSSDELVYENYIFFGVAPGTDGLNLNEPGAKALNSFLSFVPKASKKQLAVRMIDSETTFPVLEDKEKQQALINETIALAKGKGFDGIILDLEVSAIPFDSLVKQINEFTKLFYAEAKKNDLAFSITMYGDVFYRVRPFEVKTLAKSADRVLIMAYDFSKAKGNPGPNFPLYGSENYGYDYEEMIDDFLDAVPANKLTVVFGLFGYDWIVDEKGKATEQAKALTLTQIENKFVANCTYNNCLVTQEKQTTEGKITYTDAEKKNHVVWYENLKSIAAKKAYLKARGINSFSYWAYSYF